MKVLGGNKKFLIAEISAEDFYLLTGQPIYDRDVYYNSNHAVEVEKIIGKSFSIKQTCENQRNAKAAWEQREKVQEGLQEISDLLDKICFPIKPTQGNLE